MIISRCVRCRATVIYLHILGICISGCAAVNTAIEPIAGSIDEFASPELSARAKQTRDDPVGYMQKVLANCRELEQYTVAFTRQERRGLGLFKTLREPELIACRFRRNPFSIYMKWLDPDIKYGESTYVAGEAGDKVRFVPRNGLFGLSPSIHRVELQTPVIWGEARYPLTDFGLERMMERTFASIERAGDDWTLSYEGLTRLSHEDRIVHFLRLEFPQTLYRTPIQELFIDTETDLPACTRILYLSGKLEAAYVWADVDPKARFDDEDFLLEAERELDQPPVSAKTIADEQQRK